MRKLIIMIGLIVLLAWPTLNAIAQAELPIVYINQPDVASGKVTVELSVIEQKADASGSFVAGLTAAEFEVFEDNKPVPASDLTVTSEMPGIAVVLVLDTGKFVSQQPGVTGSTRWADEKGLATDLISNRLTAPNDYIGVIGVVKEVTPVLSLLNDGGRAANAVNNDITPYNDKTPLRAGIDQALKLFKDPAVPPNLRRAIVVFSDGIDVTKNPDEFSDLIRRALEDDITFYTIGMASPNSEANFEASGLERLAKQTNGAFVKHDSQDQHMQVLALFDRIASQRQQYRLAYPTHLAQGQHELRIKIKTPEGDVEAPPVTFVSVLKVPELAITVDKHEVTRGETVPITPTWTATDGYNRPPLKIEYLVAGKVISASMTLDPFVWDTSTEPATPGEYAIEARGYDSVLLDEPPAFSNQAVVKMNIPAPEQVVQSIGQNWLALLLLPLVVVLLILVVPNRKKIAQTTRAVTQRLTPTRLLTPPSSTQYKLSALSLGQEFPLTQRTMRIGRDPGCDIVLMDLSVSNLHAELTQTQGQAGASTYMIADLTSANHTFVNGRQLQPGPVKGQPGQPVVLNPSDMIRVGAVELQFNYGKVTRRLLGG